MAVDQLSKKCPDGTTLGQSATDLVGFYGATPVVQPTAAAQAAITDGSTGVAAPTNGVQPLTATYNSTLIINALATIIAQTNAMRTALVNTGIMKGS
jgi:hypothetical protein